MLSDTENINIDHSHTYRLQFKGALNSPSIDWCGEVKVIPQVSGGILMVSLLINPTDLYNLLDQFKNLNLTLLPIEYEIPKSDLQSRESVDTSPWITSGTLLPDQAQIDCKEI
jgi:hypothetical protein